MKQLALIIPVYNEEKAIKDVLIKWDKTFKELNIKYYEIHVYNDGSKDNTFKIMEETAVILPKIIPHNKTNSGHGPTILQGYKENADNFEWLMQIDSDDEMPPDKFTELWENKDNYDFLIGIRENRIQPLPRKIISLISRICVKICYGNGVYDVNCPYRLMKTSVFKNLYDKIPKNTFAPNLIISGLAAKNKLKIYQTKVPYQFRKTGEVSIKKWKLFKAAVKSFYQTIKFALKNL